MAGKGRKWGRIAIIVLMIALMTAVLGTTALMAADQSGQDVSTLEAGKTLEGPGFFGSSLVVVDGTVEGTTFAFGEQIKINGVINGDLIAVGRDIVINGQVNGNIYVAGLDLKLGSTVSGDVFMAGQDVDSARETVIGRDLFVAGQKVALDGQIGRLLKGGAEEIILSGSVGKDASLDATRVHVLNGATIGGNLNYRSENQALVSPGAVISGQTNWEQVKSAAAQERSTPSINWWSILLGIASALLIWFLIRLWQPQFWPAIAETVDQQPLRVLGIGLLALLLTPLLVILLMITIIGLPVGIIISLVYGVMLYLSKIFAAVFMGSWLTRYLGWNEVHKGVWPVLLSLVILALLSLIPVVGFIVGLLVILIGMGALIVYSLGKPEVDTEMPE